MAADAVAPAAISFMVTHGRGLVCLPMTSERVAELGRGAAGRGAAARGPGRSRRRGVRAGPRGPRHRGARQAPGCALQDDGRDSDDANFDLSLPVDARTYETAAQILRDLRIVSVRLMTNNPVKRRSLEALGASVTELVPLETVPTDENLHYLQTKRDGLEHQILLDLELVEMG